MQFIPRSDNLRFLLCVLPIVLFGLVSARQAAGEEAHSPEIIAQGFNISVPQNGMLGQFGRLRVRIEAPERIEKLYIRERSYEIDLAETLDQSNYHLFAIPKRVRRYKDVTLDFRNYINEKISAPGRYEFTIQVNDEDGGATTARLAILVAAQKTEKDEKSNVDAVSMKTGRFRFERSGPGPVEGATAFGITWKTIDETAVVIRIGFLSAGYSIADGLPSSQYEKIAGTSDLDSQRGEIDQAGFTASAELPTARNAAAGRIMAIAAPHRYCLLRMDRSETSLSEIGTTVILTGGYKCAERLTTSRIEILAGKNL